MSTFILIVFWLEFLATIVTVAELSGEHPRFRAPVTVGFDAASLIIRLAVLAWAAFLLWGR